MFLYGDLASSSCENVFLPSASLPTPSLIRPRPHHLRNPENEIFRALFLPFVIPQILRACASAYGHEVSFRMCSHGQRREEEEETRSDFGRRGSR